METTQPKYPEFLLEILKLKYEKPEEDWSQSNYCPKFLKLAQSSYAFRLTVISQISVISKTFFVCFLQADIDLSKRAGELSEEEVDKIVTIMQNPRQYKIPDWFLNRQKDIKDGK